MSERLTDERLTLLEQSLAKIENDYHPTCESVNYGSGCPGATDESRDFWRRAVDAIPGMLAELRAHRAAALTAEEAEALEWLIRHVNATTIPGVRPRADKAAALAVLDRLIGVDRE